jgi:hypothetical protein
MNKLKSIISNYKRSLLTLDNKELTTGSKLALVIFMFIVFIILNHGLTVHNKFIETPSERFGIKCIELVNQNKIYKNFELNDFKSYKRSKQNFGSDEKCKNLENKYFNVINNTEIQSKISLSLNISKNLFLLNTTLNKKNTEYSDALLEVVAKQDPNKSILSTSADNIKYETDKLKNEISIMEKQLKNVNNISEINSVEIFRKYINENESIILKEYSSYNLYFKLKYILNLFIFLIPLWIVFYFLYRKFKDKGHGIVSYLSLIVANVAAFYIVFNLLSLVYELLPKMFFVKIINFLNQYDLTIIWNILIILFFMSLFGFFIYKIQTNKEKDSSDKIKLYRTKLLNICVKCGNHHNKEDKYCGVCRNELLVTCSSCGLMTSSAYDFCTNCNIKI